MWQMLRVWVHGCDPGRVSDGSRLALCQTLSIECPSSIFFWHACFAIKLLALCDSYHVECLSLPPLFPPKPFDCCCCCLSVVVCCFLHINRSGLNHNTQYYAWLPIRYVVCWTERDQRNIYQAPMRAKKRKTQSF